jgi:hypothetical protein
VASDTVTTAVGAAISELHDRELPQKDTLCGCFWGALVLRAAGVENIDQDAVAVEAGTTLPEGDPVTFVPRGATPRRDYRLELPPAADPARGGTAAPALARAVERLSGGRLAAVSIAGPWTADSVPFLVEHAAAAVLVANIRTGLLWGSRPDPPLLLAYLAGEPVEGPPPEWDTGHYVNLVAALRARDRSLIVVRDSYRTLGWNGYHLQPADAVAKALARGDGREGGVLCFCAAEDEASLRDRLAGSYDLRDWDNGSVSASP